MTLVVARRAGVLAGRLAASLRSRPSIPAIAVEWSAADGDRIDAGADLARVRDPWARCYRERTALNLLCHLSGVATLTASFVDAGGPGSRSAIPARRLPV